MKLLAECKVLVTPTSYGREDPMLKSELENSVREVVYNMTGKPLSSSDLMMLLPGVDGYIAGLDEIDSAALAAADQLQVITRYGVGVDNVDLEFCKSKGICVTNTPGANSGSVAELAMGLILCLLRKIPFAIEETRLGEWPRLQGLSLHGKTIGLLGFGRIGQQMASRLAPFGCSVLAHDPNIKTNLGFQVEMTSLNDLLQRSDLVSLHLPAAPGTIDMVNRDFLDQMKVGAYLVNTSRGELIVESDLLEAMNNGHLTGAALDVFRRQPPDPGSPILTHPKVLVTPHMGAHSDDATNQMGWMALRECLNVLQGNDPQYPVII